MTEDESDKLSASTGREMSINEYREHMERSFNADFAKIAREEYERRQQPTGYGLTPREYGASLRKSFNQTFLREAQKKHECGRK